MSKSASPSSAPNEQISTFIDYYLSLSISPKYAVLLNGPWGSGKTWFIEKLIEKHDRKKFLYVSLFGVTSVEQIEDQFFQQLHPTLASKPFALGAMLVKGAIKKGLDIELDEKLNAKQFLTDSSGRVLIFDDFERCKMPPEETLGYINTFVERQGQKVLIVSNELEIKGSREFRRIKEKLIGRTFTISPDLSGALDIFISEATDPKCKAALEANAPQLVAMYSEGKHFNLRTLRYSVLEYQRLFSYLPARAQEHQEYQAACIRTLFALSVDLSTGMLAVEDIRHLSNYLYQSSRKRTRVTSVDKGKKKEEKFDEVGNLIDQGFFEKHYSILNEIIPNEETLHQFFEYGSVPKETIEKAVASSSYFQDENTPDWKRLWHIWDLQEDEFQKLYKSVTRDFEAGKFSEQGILKHVCATHLFLARRKIVPITLKAMAAKIAKTLLKLDRGNKIEVLSREDEDFGDPYPAYSGLGFMDHQSPEFQAVVDAIANYQKRRVDQEIASAAPTLLATMKSNTKTFRNQLVISKSSDAVYSREPVLKNIKPKDFLDAVVSLHPTARKDVDYVLRDRYRLVGGSPQLMDELPWLQKVKALTKQRLPKLKQPTRFHMEEFLRDLEKGLEILVNHQKSEAP